MSQWFSNRERGRFYGIWSTAHSMGEGLTFLGTATLVSAFTWQAGFIGPGLFCICTVAALYYFLQDRPRTLGLPTVTVWRNDHPSLAEEPAIKERTTSQMQWQILRRPAMWILGLSCAAMSATRYAINSWGILYLQEAKGYSLVEAGSILGLNTMAGIAGCAAYGFISDRFFAARRPPVTLMYGIMEIVAMVMIFFIPGHHPTLLSISFVLYGFSLSGILAALGGLFAIDIASKKASGAAMGFIGVFSYLGAAIQERLSGLLIQRGTTLIDGVRHYDFQQPIVFWISMSVLSMLLAGSLWRVKASD
jgi:MFS transporter, OPA family, sugar phosphate sensor protein UhpC